MFEEIIRLADKYLPQLSSEEQSQVHFTEELELVREMATLLPEKIRREHYNQSRSVP